MAIMGIGNNIGTTSVNLAVGEEILLEIPNDYKSGKGWFAKGGATGTIKWLGDDRDLLRGFMAENTNIGSLRINPNKSSASVLYLQKLSGENRIYFFAETGESAVCNVTQIPVHDHSSIMQGGPAYATYHTNPEEQKKQEQ
jgi:hypothetical protein